ncbi:uncharacterized protein TNCV_911481 [Trichonephila clavipes]|nr:uncharacterized protein TNCV_911481 [Trichonephila clavipes]
MDVCKCIVPLRHGGTLNSRRAASHLVWLVEGEERWQASDHPQSVLPLNWGGTEPNRSVICMVLKATDNYRRHLALCHDEFRGPRSGLCDQVALYHVAKAAEWYRYRIVVCLVTSSSPIPLKTRRVGQRCTLNLSRAETSCRWCGGVVRRGGVSSGVVHVT